MSCTCKNCQEANASNVLEIRQGLYLVEVGKNDDDGMFSISSARLKALEEWERLKGYARMGAKSKPDRDGSIGRAIAFFLLLLVLGFVVLTALEILRNVLLSHFAVGA